MSDILEQLSSFDPQVRLDTLQALLKEETFPAEKTDHNMHLHTFFSYNGEGWSPTRIAYEMKKLGLYSAAMCDFDTLTGVEEFLGAADLLQLRSAASFESRTFFQEYADKEINSPGEPGVFYFMGSGYVRPPQEPEAAAALDNMLKQSHKRNRVLIDRINKALDGRLALDYDKDVLVLTPAGNATERHIVSAYYYKALTQFGTPEKAAAFWAEVFKADVAELTAKITQVNPFNEYLRGKLMKRGGLGYEQPSPNAFPLLDDVIRTIRISRALPMSAWLDGASDGEKDPRTQLACLASKGVEAVNIIPDRNWNFKDPAVQAKKVAALDEYVAAATELELPIIVGTEGNKPGQRLVDDFQAEAVKRHSDIFRRGTSILVGHTRMMRFANTSYIDEGFCGMPSLLHQRSHGARAERRRPF